MKKLLIEWVFHRIAYSNAIFLEKLVIIANVLFHDWRIYPSYGANSIIGKIPQERIFEIYHDMDQDSMTQLLRFHNVCQYPEITGLNETFKIRLHRLPFQVNELDLVACPIEVWRKS